MANIKDYEGAVNINGDITPITRVPIEQVTPNDWPTMDFNLLWDQRIILNNRMNLAYSSGNANIALQIQKGLNMLDSLLRQRAESNETTNPSGIIS